MTSNKIATLLACFCILTGGYMLLDSFILSSGRVTDRLMVAHDLSDRLSKFLERDELESFSTSSQGQHLSTTLHNLALGDRTLNIVIGTILFTAGVLGVLGLRFSVPREQFGDTAITTAEQVADGDAEEAV